MRQTYTTISVPKDDLTAAEQTFGKLLPVGSRLGMGTRAFAMLTPEQQMELIRTYRTQPVVGLDTRSIGMASALG